MFGICHSAQLLQFPGHFPLSLPRFSDPIRVRLRHGSRFGRPYGATTTHSMKGTVKI